jgi:peroxiredoxin
LTGTSLQPPYPAPDWKLSDAGGRPHTSADLQGRPTVLAFYQGGACDHCLKLLAMLNEYAATREGSALRVVAISPEPRAELAATPKFERVLLLSDERLEVFRRFGCVADDAPRHGVFLLNPEGHVVWSRISAEAMTDLAPLRRAVSGG